MGEATATQRTQVRPFARVRPHVVPQQVRRHEVLPADRTTVGSVYADSVRPEMPFPRNVPAECLAADAAWKPGLGGVHPHVDGQRRLRLVALPALPAEEVLRPRVRLHVYRQRVLIGEAMAALWTLLLPALPVVGPHVEADVLDKLPADLASQPAAVRPLDSVVDLHVPPQFLDRLSAHAARPRRSASHAAVDQLVLVHVDDNLPADVARLRLRRPAAVNLAMPVQIHDLFAADVAGLRLGSLVQVSLSMLVQVRDHLPADLARPRTGTSFSAIRYVMCPQVPLHIDDTDAAEHTRLRLSGLPSMHGTHMSVDVLEEFPADLASLAPCPQRPTLFLEVGFRGNRFQRTVDVCPVLSYVSPNGHVVLKRLVADGALVGFPIAVGLPVFRES